MEKHLTDGVEVRRGSGNVFADLGLPDAGKLQIKTGLVMEILGYDIQITVQPAAEPIGHLTLALG